MMTRIGLSDAASTALEAIGLDNMSAIKDLTVDDIPSIVKRG
jgi:hypothetical protein